MQATQWWQRSARLGNTNARYRLGLMCQEQHQGKLVSECLDWFEQAATDHAEAQLILARWYSTQPGADTDAIKWLEQAAELGNRDAQYLLGQRYVQGKRGRQTTRPRPALNDKRCGSAATGCVVTASQAGLTHPCFRHHQQSGQCGFCRGRALAWAWRIWPGDRVSADPALGRRLELVAGHGSREAEYQLSLQQVDREQQIHWLTGR